MMKAVIFTLGCKVNSCESSALAKMLKDRGYEVSESLGYADIFIINTCAVTAEAEKKSRQAIARVCKYNPNCKIIVTGCASENTPQSFVEKQNVVLVTGAKQKSRLADLIDEVAQRSSQNSLSGKLALSRGLKLKGEAANLLGRRAGVKGSTMPKGTFISEDEKAYDELEIYTSTKDRQFIKIQDGCNNFCSYCIIPYLRGREKSRSKESILSEAQNTTAPEIVLTGINISSYDLQNGGLSQLLESMSVLDKRIRLGSLEANVVTTRLLSAAKNLKNFAPHFHLSLQSGSDAVLKAMNRKYDSETFLNKCALIRKYFPDAAITTDVIVGFPSETEADFENTLNACKSAAFSDIHCFVFSPRKGTKAALLKELDNETKRARLEKLSELAKKLKADYILKNIGKQLTVIFEEQENGESCGYSENYLRVYTEGFYSGIKKVKTLVPYKDGLKAKIITIKE